MFSFYVSSNRNTRGWTLQTCNVMYVTYPEHSNQWRNTFHTCTFEQTFFNVTYHNCMDRFMNFFSFIVVDKENNIYLCSLSFENMVVYILSLSERIDYENTYILILYTLIFECNRISNATQIFARDMCPAFGFCKQFGDWEGCGEGGRSYSNSKIIVLAHYSISL